MITESQLSKRLGQQAFRVLYTDKQIQERVGLIAAEINKDFVEADPLIIIGVLKGAFIFTADLVRHLHIPTVVEFISASSYVKSQSTGQVKTSIQLNAQLEGRDVLLVEDIVDSGNTVEQLLKALSAFKPKSIKICSLFIKPESMKETSPKVDYYGFTLSGGFIVGYGLDYDQAYREFPHVIEFLD